MLVRTAIRFLMVEALRPTAGEETGLWPTLAGAFVSDSRLAPIDDLSPEEQRPAVIVTTDGTDLKFANGNFSDGALEVTLDLAMVAKEPVLDDHGKIIDFVPQPSFTDPRLEAFLDELEHDCFHAIRGSAALARIFLMTRWESAPERNGEVRLPLARRIVTITGRLLKMDCASPLPGAPPEGLSRLPQPLRDVVESLPEDSYARPIAEALAGVAPVAPTRVPFTGMTLTVDLPPHDGSADVVADISIPQDPTDA